MYCEKCGEQIENNASVCSNCGAAMGIGYESVPPGGPGYAPTGNTGYGQPGPPGPPVFVVQKMSNTVGTAGFVLALLGVIFSWVPVLGWILWVLGLILSCVGLAQGKNGKPKGLAIAGLVLSLIGIVLLIVVVGSLGAMFGAMMLF
jgi:hypothetical protein